jgi:predicted amidohydrolase YtcJ
MFADGALGPRTAALFDPYEDEPENSGIIVTDKEEMTEKALSASRGGINVAVHAIGDRANHNVLDVFEVVRKDEQARIMQGEDVPALRHRIEHAQLLHPHDFGRFANLGVIASMQPIHATSDSEMAEQYWGERARHSYAWRTLWDSGAMLVFGSDSPVEPIEPLTGIYAAVNRIGAGEVSSSEGWYPEQRLSVAEAIQGYTMGAAFAGGWEHKMGSISPGKLADLTIFDGDLFKSEPGELLDINIAGTVINGEMVYRDW